MLRVSPALALFACALTINAIPGSIIFTDFGTPVDDWTDVVSQAPDGQSFFSGTSTTVSGVSVILSNNENEDAVTATGRAAQAKRFLLLSTVGRRCSGRWLRWHRDRGR